MSQKLFSDFPKLEREAWVEKATKDLRGKLLDDLKSHTRDKIEILPFYTEEDLKKSDQPVKDEEGWSVIQEIFVEDELKSNHKSLDLLNKGVNGFIYYLTPNVDLSILLKDVLIEHIAIHLVTEGNGIEVYNEFLKVAENRSLDSSELNFTVNIDPIENILRTGSWFSNEESDFNQIAQLAKNNVRLALNANVYANSGATSAQQLGLALSHAYETIQKTGLEDFSKLWFNFAIGGEYFEEIAKFRAARRLWKLFLEEAGLSDSPMKIYAETGLRNKTIYDPWVNMLRSTTEGMSAVLGGCDELNIKPYDISFSESSDFSERIARNQQLLLEHESYMSRVVDPSKGSYFIEELTEKIAKQAWDIFRLIESKGGILASIKSGFVQEMIKKSADEQQALYDSGELTLLGTNLYPNKDEVVKVKLSSPMFYKKLVDYEFKPLEQRRLSEKDEMERLATEKA